MRITLVRDLWLTIWEISQKGATICQKRLTYLCVKWDALGLHDPPEQTPVHEPLEPPPSHKETNLSLIAACRSFGSLFCFSADEQTKLFWSKKGRRAAAVVRAEKERSEIGDSSLFLDVVWGRLVDNFTIPHGTVEDTDVQGMDDIKSTIDDEPPKTPPGRNEELDEESVLKTPTRKKVRVDEPSFNLLTPSPTPVGASAFSNQLANQEMPHPRPVRHDTRPPVQDEKNNSIPTPHASTGQTPLQQKDATQMSNSENVRSSAEANPSPSSPKTQEGKENDFPSSVKDHKADKQTSSDDIPAHRTTDHGMGEGSGEEEAPVDDEPRKGIVVILSSYCILEF